MSGRGGRGRGGRGGGFGRGGARSIVANSVPWTTDAGIVLDGKPSELFPAYNVHRASGLTKKEEKQVSYFLLFREQCHASPLYTEARTWKNNLGGRAGRSYGQEQANNRYGETSKATVDPFTAVPTWSQKFHKVERTLPDLGSRPFANEFFPPELHATLDGDDVPAGPAHKKRKTGPKTLALSSITSLKTAEELFLPEAEVETVQKNGAPSFDKALQLLNSVEKRNEDGDDQGFLSGEDDDEWVKNPDDEDGEGQVDEDEAYEDESGDDYNAEQYFDANQDDDDFDDGGDDGGDYL